MAKKIQPGDTFLPYLLRFSRWVGLFEVVEGPYEDRSPRFTSIDDPYVIRFKVKPRIWLDRDETIPIDLPELWDHLSFTKGRTKSDYYLGPLRRSAQQIAPEDAAVLIDRLKQQQKQRIQYPVDQAEWEAAIETTVRRGDRVVELTIPPAENVAAPTAETIDSVDLSRESHDIQGSLGLIGKTMGFKIWFPAHDRQAILAHRPQLQDALLPALPLGFDNFTMSTVQAIDVLWVKGRSIIRAFEVEHTTAIYSGLLRMADLLALQPNLNISLHIVAPIERKRKFFGEVKRPVFSFLEPKALHDVCTFLSYDEVRKLADLETLPYMKSDYLDEIAEEPE